MAVRRSRDLKIVYTTDNKNNLLSVQRTYVNVSTGETETIITPLLLARQYNSQWKLEPLDRKPRRIEVCKSIDGKESRLDSLIPYDPSDAMHKEHAREIASSPNVLLYNYIGEYRRA